MKIKNKGVNFVSKSYLCLEKEGKYNVIYIIGNGDEK